MSKPYQYTLKSSNNAIPAHRKTSSLVHTLATSTNENGYQQMKMWKDVDAKIEAAARNSNMTTLN